MQINGTALSMMRGDTDALTVSCEGRPFQTGDTVTMTVGYNDLGAPPGCVQPVLQKSETDFDNEGRATFRFAPEDTARLVAMDYLYDVQLVGSDVGTKTIIEPSPFTLRGDVTP